LHGRRRWPPLFVVKRVFGGGSTYRSPVPMKSAASRGAEAAAGGASGAAGPPPIGATTGLAEPRAGAVSCARTAPAFVTGHAVRLPASARPAAPGRAPAPEGTPAASRPARRRTAAARRRSSGPAHSTAARGQPVPRQSAPHSASVECGGCGARPACAVGLSAQRPVVVATPQGPLSGLAHHGPAGQGALRYSRHSLDSAYAGGHRRVLLRAPSAGSARIRPRRASSAASCAAQDPAPGPLGASRACT